MKGFKLFLQGLAGVLFAGCAAAAVGTWMLPGENDLLFQLGGIRLSASGLGAAAALLAALLFADGWIGVRKRQHPEADRKALRLLDGLGFGLLPGIAVWKAFAHETVLGEGNPVPPGILQADWLTQAGRYRPARAEMILALVMFAGICLWLMLRKKDLPDNGDLFGVCAAVWAAGRTVTESLRAQALFPGIPWLAGWAALAVMAAVLVAWTIRAFRKKKNTGYAYACIPVFVCSGAMLALLRFGVLLGENAPAVLAMQAVCALLALKAVLCMGRVTRPDA